MKKITLQVNGREMTFSEEELIAILEEHFSDKTSKTEVQTTKGVQTEVKTTQAKTAQAEETQCFDVFPYSIDRSLFQEEREDAQQEWTRQIILNALSHAYSGLFRYNKPYQVVIPAKTWSSHISAWDLIDIARGYGNGIAEWAELALVWAQRISNGETWETLCNEPDTDARPRIVSWKDNALRCVGGKGVPATCVGKVSLDISIPLIEAVPLVVRYEGYRPELIRFDLKKEPRWLK